MRFPGNLVATSLPALSASSVNCPAGQVEILSRSSPSIKTLEMVFVAQEKMCSLGPSGPRTSTLPCKQAVVCRSLALNSRATESMPWSRSLRGAALVASKTCSWTDLGVASLRAAMQAGGNGLKCKPMQLSCECGFALRWYGVSKAL